jgi:hypothetical protein
MGRATPLIHVQGERSRAIDISKSSGLVSDGVPDEGKVEEVGVRDGA